MTDDKKKEDDASQEEASEISDRLFEEALRSIEKIEKKAKTQEAKTDKVYEIDIDESETSEDLDLLMKMIEQSDQAEKESPEDDAGADADPEETSDAGEDSILNGGSSALGKLLEEEQRLEKEAHFLQSMLGDVRESEGREDFQEILDQKESQIQALLESFKRLQGDFENFKKRIDRDKESTLRFSNEKLLKSILPILDNFERALEHAKTTDDPKALEEGVKMIFRQFEDTLEGFGLKRIEAMGEKFDPRLHEAMVHIENADHSPNTVISIYQEGYLLYDRLLRPAKVVVSKAAETTNGSRDDG